MDTKLALVDSIENIKEKITSQEYLELLENLAKVTVSANEYVKAQKQPIIQRQRGVSLSTETSDSNSDSNLDSDSDSDSNEERYLERLQRREQKRLEKIPLEHWRVWNGTTATVEERSSRSFGTNWQDLPTKISLELASFIEIPQNVLIKKPDITKCIYKYIKEHNLQKEENKRIIDLTKPGGQALRNLLKVPESKEFTFFNLKNYLIPHYLSNPSLFIF